MGSDRIVQSGFLRCSERSVASADYRLDADPRQDSPSSIQWLSSPIG